MGKQYITLHPLANPCYILSYVPLWETCLFVPPTYVRTILLSRESSPAGNRGAGNAGTDHFTNCHYHGFFIWSVVLLIVCCMKADKYVPFKIKGAFICFQTESGNLEIPRLSLEISRTSLDFSRLNLEISRFQTQSETRWTHLYCWKIFQVTKS